MMHAVIAGSGLVTPLALGVLAHVLYERASVAAPARPPFVDSRGRRVRVRCVGSLGAAMPMRERLTRLALAAAEEALAPWEAALPGRPAALAFVAPARPGIDDKDAGAVFATLAKRARAQGAQSWTGAAGAFAALAEACRWLEDGLAEAVLVVAVDSFVSPEALLHDRDRAESDFAPLRAAPGEGAAALLLIREDRIRALGLGGPRILTSRALRGVGTDDDDAILDGIAMTTLLRDLPPALIDLAVGQRGVDALRSRDWHLATARNARRFSEGLEAFTPEDDTGRLGAAAGLSAVVHAAGALEHRMFPTLKANASAVTWAISSDGTRGVALLEGATE